MTALKKFIEESKKYTLLLSKRDVIGYDFLCKSFLEIEKQQIIDANQYGTIHYENGEQYYEQTYNKPNQ
jgi:hypothetical protein